VLDRRGRVVHDGGVTGSPGLYLIGTPFLRRKSSLIDGAADDAAELTRHLAGHLDALAGCRERSAS
jgi:putative flavoprotein involved in K+ transport